MLLALLKLDDGLAALRGNPRELPFSEGAVRGGAPGSEGALDAGVADLDGGPEDITDIGAVEPEVGGRLVFMLARPVPLELREGGPDGGPIEELVTLLAGPLGGGGVGAAEVAVSGPAFLLIHFLRFSS